MISAFYLFIPNKDIEELITENKVVDFMVNLENERILEAVTNEGVRHNITIKFFLEVINSKEFITLNGYFNSDLGCNIPCVFSDLKGVTRVSASFYSHTSSEYLEIESKFLDKLYSFNFPFIFIGDKGGVLEEMDEFMKSPIKSEFEHLISLDGIKVIKNKGDKLRSYLNIR